MSVLKTLTGVIAFTCLIAHSMALPLTESVEKDKEISNSLENTKEDINVEKITELSSNDDKIHPKYSLDKYTSSFLSENSTGASKNRAYYLVDDMLLPYKEDVSMSRSALQTKDKYWPNGVVPFEINGNFDEVESTMIEEAMKEYHNRTCIRFKRRSLEHDYISIEKHGELNCRSYVGRLKGKQELNLHPKQCAFKKDSVLHELMHALGFQHEHSRTDRDDYVIIQWPNIIEDQKPNFNKFMDTGSFGVPYDYGSIMHYPPKAFTVNQLPTIIAKQPGGESKMGKSEELSENDVKRINIMYDCE